MTVLYVFVGIIALLAVLVARQVRTYNGAGSIYYKKGVKEKLYGIYGAQLKSFPVAYKEHYISCEYGTVHALECGSTENPKLVLFHAASVGSVSWAQNVAALSEKYHLFLIDTLGEGNKSELSDVNDYPKTSEEVAGLYKDVLEKLGAEKAHVMGASYGGFICLNYAYHYPERVDKMILSGSMGVAPSVPKVIAKLTLYSFFPYKMFRKNMTQWAFGESPELKSAKEYFVAVLGRYYAPMTVSQDMLRKIENPALIIFGSRDNLVGDPKKAMEYTSCMQNAQYEVFQSGHLINVEKSAEVNKAVLDFLEKQITE